MLSLRSKAKFSHPWQLVLCELAMIHFKANICCCVSHGQSCGGTALKWAVSYTLLHLTLRTVLQRRHKGEEGDRTLQTRKLSSETWSGAGSRSHTWWTRWAGLLSVAFASSHTSWLLLCVFEWELEKMHPHSSCWSSLGLLHGTS